MNRPIAVLDTNIVLDWLVFADPRVTKLAEAITGGRIAWLSCAAMRDEAEHVLARNDWPRAACLAAFDRWATFVVAPAAHPLRCTDPDDQKFLDLALAHRAAWLLTRDRALLRLARRSALFGVTISAEWEEKEAAEAAP